MNDEAQPQRLLNTAVLLKRYSISDQTLRDWRKKFGFPEPSVIVNSRVHFWEEAPVRNWERARTAANTGAACEHGS
jgi:predicted DNA-binding transcriptional regulator AlpA